jgi:hypothetical protein
LASNPLKLLEQFISFKALLSNIIFKTYESTNNVNDVTDGLLLDMRKTYKAVFTSLEAYGVWA